MITDLEYICMKNGRYLSFGSDGTIYTGDKYEGTDGRSFKDEEEAIRWETGYRRANTRKA